MQDQQEVLALEKAQWLGLLKMDFLGLRTLTVIDDALKSVQHLGQELDLDGIPLVVTYHPAYLLRSPSQKAKSWSDLCLAARLAAESSA